MSALAGSRWAVLTAMAAVPAVLLVSACGNSTSPKAYSADTVAASANAEIIKRDSGGGFDVYPVQEDGDYIELYEGEDLREVMQYALPALHGQHVIDSASVFEYVCDNYISSGAVTAPPHATAAALRMAARRATRRDLLTPQNGGSPSVLLEHLAYEGAYTDSLTWGAELMGAPTQLIAATDNTLGWKEASVTGVVKGDYNAGRANSQFRIQYSSNNDSSYQYIDFGGVYCTDANGATGGSRLVIWSH